MRSFNFSNSRFRLNTFRSTDTRVLTSGPVLVSRPVLSGFMFRDGYYYRMHTYVGFTLSATPAVWESPETLTLSAGWYVYSPSSLRGYFSTDLTYTATLSDDTTNKVFGWREQAYKNGRTVVSSSLYCMVNEIPNQPPTLSDGVGYITGIPEAGQTLYKPEGQFRWNTDLLGPLSLSGVWFKNGVNTGVTLSTYNDTAPNDNIQYRVTGTTWGGSRTQYSRKYYITDKYPTIIQSLSTSIFPRMETLSGGELHMNMFSVKDHNTRTYVRNPNLWVNDIIQQFTGCVVHKPHYCYESYGGVLITPQHVLYCGHANPSAGGTSIWGPAPAILTFVRSDNTPVSAVQLHQYNLLKPVPPYDQPGNFDLCVAVLDRNMVDEGLHVVPISPIWGDESPSFYGLTAWSPDTYLRDEGDNFWSQYQTMALNYAPYYFNPLSAWKPFVEIAVSQGAGRGTNSIPPLPFKPLPYPLVNGNVPQYNDIMCHAIDVYGTYTRWNTLSAYRYLVWDGDSGTPTFHIYNNTLYLAGILVSAPWGREAISPGKVSWINDAIEQADLRAISMGRLSATTGYRISATPSVYIQ